MRFSPWEPPRFLWAAIEGVCGAILQPGRLKVQPLVPVSWRWVGIRQLSYHGRQISYFATREEPGKTFGVYACGEVASEHELELYDEDVSDSVHVLDPAICHVALRQPGRVALLLGHTGTATSIVAVEMTDLLADTATDMRFYDSEAYRWRTGTLMPELPGRGFSVTIEAGGYRLFIFDEHSAAVKADETRSNETK